MQVEPTEFIGRLNEGKREIKDGFWVFCSKSWVNVDAIMFTAVRSRFGEESGFVLDIRSLKGL